MYLGAHEPIPRPGRRAPALLAKRYRRYHRPQHLVCVPVNPLRQDAGHDRVSVRPRRGAGECNLITCAEGPRRLPYPRRCPGDSRRRARRRRFLARDRIHLRRQPRAQRRGRQAGDPQAAALPRRRPMRRAGRRRRREVRRNNTTLSGTGTVRPADRASRAPLRDPSRAGSIRVAADARSTRRPRPCPGAIPTAPFPRPRRPSPSRPLSITNPFPFSARPATDYSRFSFLRRTDARRPTSSPPLANEPAALPPASSPRTPRWRR